MNRDDVWVRQAGRQVGLTRKPRPILGVGGEVGRQHLQRFLARQPGMRRQVHVAHPAPAQNSQDCVSGEELADCK